jgi:hypothetical protein
MNPISNSCLFHVKFDFLQHDYFLRIHDIISYFGQMVPPDSDHPKHQNQAMVVVQQMAQLAFV